MSIDEWHEKYTPPIVSKRAPKIVPPVPERFRGPTIQVPQQTKASKAALGQHQPTIWSKRSEKNLMSIKRAGGNHAKWHEKFSQEPEITAHWPKENLDEWHAYYPHEARPEKS